MEYKVITDLAFTYIGLVTTMTKHYVDKGVPLIFNSSIKVTGIETSNPVFLDIEFAQKNKTRMHKKGDVLTVHTGDIGVSAVIPESLDGSLGFATIVSRITNTDIILPEYLCAFLNYGGGKEQLYKYSRDARNNLNLTDFNKLIVPVPEIEVQRSIIDRMTRLLKFIEKRNQELLLLDELVKARFVELFGDPSLNTKGYPIKSLPEIAEYWNGLTYKPEDVADEGTIVLRSSNIQNAQLDFEDTVRVTCSIGEKKYVKDNDILMCSRNGSARLVGKVALIKDIKEPMSFGAFMMIIRSQYYPYLMTFFQMPAFRAQITTGATTTINQITGRMLDNVKLPVPEKAELNSFISFIEQVDKSKSVVQKSLDEAQLLFDSLMQQYFG